MTGPNPQAPIHLFEEQPCPRKSWREKSLSAMGIGEGPEAIFRRVEPCRTYKMRGTFKKTKKLEPHLELGKCLHLYFYVQHPRLD